MKLGEYLQPETPKAPTSMRLSEYLSDTEETKTWVDTAIDYVTKASSVLFSLETGSKSIGAGIAEELSFGALEAKEEDKKNTIPYAVGRVVGSVASLYTVATGLGAIGFGAKVAQIGQAATAISKYGPRFIPRAMMVGGTFLTHSTLTETVDQLKSGGKDIAGAGVRVLKDTGMGVLIGGIGGVANRMTAVTSAAGIGFTFGSGDALDRTIQGLTFGLFELVGSKGRDAKLRQEAVNSIKENLTKYAVNKGMPEGAAKQAAETFVVNQAAKVGGMEKVLSSQENTLSYLETLNRNIFRANAKSAVNPEVKGITFDEVVKSSTEVVKPTTPVAPAPQITVSDQSKVIQTPAPISMTDQSKVEQPQGEVKTELTPEEQLITNVEPPAEPPAIEDIGGNNIDPYDKVVNIEKKKRPSSVAKDIKEFVDKVFIPISTRLSVIDESLRDAIRKHAFSVNISTKKDMDSVVPFLNKLKAMSSEDSIKLDFALKNGDVDFIDSIVSKYDAKKDFDSVRKTLDNIYARAKDAGMDVGYIPEYFPRRISDTEGYLKFLRGTEDWGSIRKALQQAESDIGRPLLEEEKAEVINSMIRGFGKEKISVTRPSNVKERKIIQLTPEMNAFYKDSGVSLTEYIKSMNDNIEARKFFGKEKNLENSIGNYVARLVDDKIISPEDEESVRQILKSYFDKRGTHGIVTGFKNLSYVATMGSPLSAVTQIGDLAFSLYKNGFFGTVKNVVGKREITKQDIGLDLIIEEFSDSSKTGKFLTNIFKVVGLEGMDAFGKEVLINGAFDRISSLAKKEDYKLLSELQRVFGDKWKDVLDDLKNRVPTDDVKYMLFAELANFQPIALTEMPEYYVRGGNMRIFYMLKSYTIKQIDAFNNEVLREKNPKDKMLKLFKLAAALIIMNASADTVKDIILGRKTKLEDLVVDNILRVVGFSKWQLYKAREDGIFSTFLQSILPPTPFVDDIYKDAMKLTNKNKKASVSDMRIWQRIPVVGKLYYWWFGGGEEIKNKKKRNSIRD